MKIYNNSQNFPKIEKPIVFTLGNFDGVHLGHQHLIRNAKLIADSNRCELTVLTFNNHPLKILKPTVRIKTIYSLEEKIELLKNLGVDNLILLDFTKQFAKQTPEAFLANLQQSFLLSTLVLGHDANIGRDKTGTKKLINNLADSLKFSVTYVSPYFYNGTLVCSSLIRKNLLSGKIAFVEKYLGRKYSISCRVISSKQSGQITLDIEQDSILFPPPGKYRTEIISNGKHLKAELNISQNGLLYATCRENFEQNSLLQFILCK